MALTLWVILQLWFYSTDRCSCDIVPQLWNVVTSFHSCGIHMIFRVIYIIVNCKLFNQIFDLHCHNCAVCMWVSFNYGSTAQTAVAVTSFHSCAMLWRHSTVVKSCNVISHEWWRISSVYYSYIICHTTVAVTLFHNCGMLWRSSIAWIYSTLYIQVWNQPSIYNFISPPQHGSISVIKKKK